MDKTKKTFLWQHYKKMTQPHVKHSQFVLMFEHGIIGNRIRSQRKLTVFTSRKNRCYKTRIYDYLLRRWNTGARYVETSNAALKKRKVKNALYQVSKNLYRVRYNELTVLDLPVLLSLSVEQSTSETEESEY